MSTLISRIGSNGFIRVLSSYEESSPDITGLKIFAFPKNTYTEQCWCFEEWWCLYCVLDVIMRCQNDSQCQNGGLCGLHDVRNGSCNCNAGWTGEHCESKTAPTPYSRNHWINHWSMKFDLFKDPASHTCFGGTVVPSWSLIQEVWTLLLQWQIF